jgi:hypothetical protein
VAGMFAVRETVLALQSLSYPTRPAPAAFPILPSLTHPCRLLIMQYLFPGWKVTKYLTLFTQPWEGDGECEGGE